MQYANQQLAHTCQTFSLQSRPVAQEASSQNIYRWDPPRPHQFGRVPADDQEARHFHYVCLWCSLASTITCTYQLSSFFSQSHEEPCHLIIAYQGSLTCYLEVLFILAPFVEYQFIISPSNSEFVNWFNCPCHPYYLLASALLACEAESGFLLVGRHRSSAPPLIYRYLIEADHHYFEAFILVGFTSL